MKATLLLLLAGCSAAAAPAPAPRPAVVTEVPASADAAARDRPEGSRVVVLDLTRPGAAARVLSQGLTAAGGPDVSPDGTRIAFVAREGAAGPSSIWTCAPDGSGRVRSAEGVADCGSAAFLADGRIVYPAIVTETVSALFVTDAKGGAPHRITFSGGVDADPVALRDGRVAFVSRAPGKTASEPFCVHVDGTGVSAGRADDAAPARRDAAGLVARDAEWRAVECVPLAPRRRPQGHLSVVDPSKTTGDVFCVDARPAGADAARRVRFVLLDGSRSAMGDVPLEADGSFFVRVPADVPLGLDLLDADGKVVARQRTAFWVRPGETRGCIGCHEDPDTTPPNVRPAAVLREPVTLGAVRVTTESR